MPSHSVVRPATADDYVEVWRLFRALWTENAMFSISEQKVDYYITRLLHPETIGPTDTGPRGFIGVIGPVGALEACIMLTVGSVWYSEDWTLDEHLNFVDPAHRQSEHAKALISYAKHCADKIGIRLVIGVLSTHRTAAKVRLYGQMLTPSGAFFVHPAPQGGSMTMKDEIVKLHVRRPSAHRKSRPPKRVRDELKRFRGQGDAL